MLTDPTPQPVPATASHVVTKMSIIKDTTNSLYNLLIPAAGVLLHLYCFPYKKKLHKQEKRTVATMLRFSIPIQYIQAVQFVPDNMYENQNLREMSNRLTWVRFPTL